MILLVCGGRDYPNREMAFKAMDALHAKVPVGRLVNGACRTGADLYGREWARNNEVRCSSFQANWSQGKKAGPLRNQWMLDEAKPDLVLAFPGGRGTADMIRRALDAGVAVLHVRDHA